MLKIITGYTSLEAFYWKPNRRCVFAKRKFCAL